MSTRTKSWLTLALAAALLVVLAWQQGLIGGTGGSGSTTVGTISESSLPAQAKATLALIDRGGPFRYSQDGAVFQNAEGLLPRQPRGYYHEYTVETPGSSDRGARRIVTGGPGEHYWTQDHYRSFMKIRRK